LIGSFSELKVRPPCARVAIRTTAAFKSRKLPVPLEGMLYVRARFTDQIELCWVLRTAHVILEADLDDWKTGDFEQLAIFVENESDLG
jgi:hypothetical protein